MRSIRLLLTWGILSAASSIAGAAEKTEVKTVEWYMQEENKPALEATLKKCQNTPVNWKMTLTVKTPHSLNTNSLPESLHRRSSGSYSE